MRTAAAIGAVLVIAAAAVGCDPAEPEVSPKTVFPTTTDSATTLAPGTSIVDTTPGSGPATTTPSVPSTDPSPTTPSTAPEPSYPVPTYVDGAGFDDHSVPRVATVEEWLGLARPGVGGQKAVKFVVPDMATPGINWLDSNFYALHDEWFWFRLLNGQPVTSSKFAPVRGPRFATVRDIYNWATAQKPGSLPLDLAFTNGRGAERRLYSSYFYDLALGAARRMTVGSIVRFAGRDNAAPRWLIELEFTDNPTPEILQQTFDRLRATAPKEIGGQLGWLIRSPAQAALAAELKKAGNPLGALAVRFEELVPPGTANVYSQGITAGRLLYVGDGGAELARAKDDDVIVMEHVPDYLPPARAIITSDLQTPLAHVNLLARNRRIPNLSISGIHDNAGLRQAARVRSLVAIEATADGRVRIVVLSQDQYDAWKRARSTPPTAVEQPDLAGIPPVLDLTALAKATKGQADIERLRTVIGGKAAGYLTLLSTPGLTAPPTPLAITVGPYREHVAALRSSIEAVLRDSEFAKSARARWLLLEGADAYADMFPGVDDAAYRNEFTRTRPPATLVGKVLAAGGVRSMVKGRPIAAPTLAAITRQLRSTFGDYADTAGLRFRSSSTVEDIEGFNGAGLYTSYTGYFRPERLDDEKDRDKTIASAIAKAWASYWGFEAFEERRLEQIDHLSGGMGLVVHARFDDDLERNNGVATYTFLPGGGPNDALVDVNVQHGSLDVTNPDNEAGQQPEVLRVRRISGRAPAVERVSRSTVAPVRDVLDDSAALELFRQLDAVATAWRARLNAALPTAQRMQTVVLDFEFKTVDRGWPALVAGKEPFPARLVVRQVRSLDPGMRGASDELRRQPVPRDILSRARLVRRFECSNDLAWTEVTTDPLRLPDMGYSVTPWGDRDERTAGPSCTGRVLFAAPDEVLLGIVDDAGSFAVVDIAPTS